MKVLFFILLTITFISNYAVAEDRSYLNRFTQEEVDKIMGHFTTVNFRFDGNNSDSDELLEAFNSGLFADENHLDNFTAGSVIHGYIDTAGREDSSETIIKFFEKVENLRNVYDSGGKAIYKTSIRVDERGETLYWGDELIDDGLLTDQKETRFVKVKPNASMTNEFELKHVMVKEAGGYKILTISKGTPNSYIMKPGDIRGLTELYPYQNGYLFYSASIVNFRKFATTESPENLQKKNTGMFKSITSLF